MLIEPAFAQQDKDEDAAQRAKDGDGFKTTITQLRQCATLAGSGKLGSEPHEECFAFSADRTQRERVYLSYQMTRPYRYQAMASEVESQHSDDGRSDTNSLALLPYERTHLGIPVVVLTAAQAVDPKASNEDQRASAQLWQTWKAGHDALAARSARGRSVVVPATGHFIQLDQPRAVTEAIAEVVVAVRKGR